MNNKGNSDQDFEVKRVSIDEIFEDLSDTEIKIQSVEAHRGAIRQGEVIERTFIPSSYNKYKNFDPRKYRRRKKDLLPFHKLGFDNKYPYMLLDLLQQSGLHRRAWKSSCNIAYGNGWVAKGNDGENFLNWLKSKKFTSSVTKEALAQLGAFGGFYSYFVFVDNMESIENAEDGSVKISKKPILDRIEIGKYTHYRVGKEEVEMDDIEYYGKVKYHWYYPDFSEKSIEKQFLKGIRVYEGIEQVDLSEPTLVQEDKSQKFYTKEEFDIHNYGRYVKLVGNTNSLFSEYYPSASYESSGSIDAILLDAMLSSFDLAGLKNGLMAGYIVTVPLADISRKDPEKYEENKAKARKKIHDELEGAENNARTIVTFRDLRDKSAGIQIAEIPHTNTSDMQKTIDRRKKDTILSAWGVADSRLIGAPPDGGLGLANQSEILRTAETIWYDGTIFPEQVQPLQEFVNEDLKEIYMFENGLTESDAEVFLSKRNVFNAIPSTEIQFSDYTRDERRAIYGAAPLTDEQREQLSREKDEELQREVIIRSSSLYVPEDQEGNRRQDPNIPDTPVSDPDPSDDNNIE